MKIEKIERLLGSYSAKRVKETNEAVSPMVRIEVVEQFADYRYVHFRVQVFLQEANEYGSHWDDVIVFGGETRMHDAIKVAKGLARMYTFAREEARQEIRDKLGL